VNKKKQKNFFLGVHWRRAVNADEQVIKVFAPLFSKRGFFFLNALQT
jgi:hypothetical protein